MLDTRSSDAPPIPGSSGGLRRRELCAASIGAVVESFDWSLYAVFTVFFTADLFGSDSPGATVVAYGGFAVGFLARPLGSMVFGRISDRRGRRFNLMLCMSIISAASLAIAALPTAATIGIWSAVAMVALRIVQGLAYGGEGPTVAAYVAETAPRWHRFLFSAISYGGIMVGSLLVFASAAVLKATIGADALRAGGWRWGFVAGGLLGLLALWIRAFAPESEEFERAHSAEAPRDKVSLRSLGGHSIALMSIFLISLGGTITYYFSLVYLPKLAGGASASQAADATSFMAVVVAVVLVAMLVVGALADRIGLVPIMRITFGYNAIVVLPVSFGLLHGRIPFEIASVVLGLGSAGFAALGSVLFALLLPVRMRALAAGVVTMATTAAFGGTFPMIAELLRGAGLRDAIPVYVFVAALAPLVGSFTVTKVPLFAKTFSKQSAHVEQGAGRPLQSPSAQRTV
ncbi:MFS transporter [Nocardia sp. CA-135398]|uniref:MFS transporter n=1 Tax=Nocardia sp. CA-135398 TaxID=3239977 RepID=UPI003D95450C